MLRDWVDNWECMWQNFKVPENPEKDYVFKPYLQFSKKGFVCLENDSWKSADREITPKDFIAINELVEITKEINNKTSMWGI